MNSMRPAKPASPSLIPVASLDSDSTVTSQRPETEARFPVTGQPKRKRQARIRIYDMEKAVGTCTRLPDGQ